MSNPKFFLKARNQPDGEYETLGGFELIGRGVDAYDMIGFCVGPEAERTLRLIAASGVASDMQLRFEDGGLFEGFFVITSIATTYSDMHGDTRYELVLRQHHQPDDSEDITPPDNLRQRYIDLIYDKVILAKCEAEELADALIDATLAWIRPA